MKREQLLRQLRDDAKALNLIFKVDMARGKGGHCVVRCGSAFSVVKSGEITPVMKRSFASNLGWCGIRGDLVTSYRANFVDGDDGWLVQFPDLPEAITGEATAAEAIENAQDALEVTLLTYVKDGRPIPNANAREGRMVSVSAAVAIKIAFIEAFRASGLTRVELAERLGKQEGEVRRMLSPYHATKLAAMEAGLAVLGKQLVVTIKNAA